MISSGASRFFATIIFLHQQCDIINFVLSLSPKKEGVGDGVELASRRYTWVNTWMKVQLYEHIKTWNVVIIKTDEIKF